MHKHPPLIDDTRLRRNSARGRPGASSAAVCCALLPWLLYTPVLIECKEAVLVGSARDTRILCAPSRSSSLVWQKIRSGATTAFPLAKGASHRARVLRLATSAPTVSVYICTDKFDSGRWSAGGVVIDARPCPPTRACVDCSRTLGRCARL